MSAPGFPYGPQVAEGGHLHTTSHVITTLAEHIQPRRRERIAQVVAGRTYAVAPVLEGLYDRGNVSAVLRTSEALGYQAVHVIESQAQFKVANRATQGADKWLDVHRWQTTRACIATLRAQGYRILAMCMEDAVPIGELDFTQPTALVFGSEMEGVSQELLGLADARVTVPMGGFTQSFNISVAAALALYHIREDRLRRLGHHGDLTETEREYLTAQYYIKAVPVASKILARRHAGAVAEEAAS